jgi:hypothetical protein
MRRTLSALSVVFALVLATFGAFSSGTRVPTAERRVVELSSTPAIAAQLAIVAPPELRSAPLRNLGTLTTAMTATIAALVGFAAVRPRRIARSVTANALVRLRGPPTRRRLASFAL